MIFSLHQRQLIPCSLAEAWQFFSDPYNLPKITPSTLNFRILSSPPQKIYSGLMIQYLVSPFWGISVPWLSEISHVEEGKTFVDEQRSGPYSLWHHQHHFRAMNDGVEIEDLVHYAFAVPLVDQLLHTVMVRPRLEEIFKFRESKIREIFGSAHR